MPILRLRKENRNRWTTLSNPTIEEIKHADALAVWVYLMAKPDDWLIIKMNIRKELGIGRDRLKHAIARLRELGLWRTEYKQGKDGQMIGSVIVVCEEISAASRRYGNPSLRVSNSSDTDSLPNTKKTKKNNTRKNNNINPAVPVKPAKQRLSLITLFGLEWDDGYSIYLPEERVCSILKKYRVSDSAQARRIVAEWSATVARGLKNKDAGASLIWLCEQEELSASKEGDELLLPFG